MDAEHVGEVRFRRAMALLEQGNVRSAVAEFGSAREHFELAGDANAVAVCDMNLGALHEELGDLHNAKVHLDAADAYFAETGQEHERGQVKLSIGVVLESLGDCDGAELSYRESLRIFAATGDAGSRAYASFNLAGVLASRGREREMLKVLTNERKQLEQAGLHDLVAECDRQLDELRESRN